MQDTTRNRFSISRLESRRQVGRKQVSATRWGKPISRCRKFVFQHTLATIQPNHSIAVHSILSTTPPQDVRTYSPQPTHQEDHGDDHHYHCACRSPRTPRPSWSPCPSRHRCSCSPPASPSEHGRQDLWCPDEAAWYFNPPPRLEGMHPSIDKLSANELTISRPLEPVEQGGTMVVAATAERTFEDLQGQVSVDVCNYTDWGLVILYYEARGVVLSSVFSDCLPYST